MDTLLALAAEPAAFPPAPPRALPTSPKITLKAVRSATAYTGGRRIADAICILSGIAAAGATVTYIILYFNNVASRAENGRIYLSGSTNYVGPSESEVYAALIVAASAIVSFIASIIIRQIMHSLFDIADCALKRHRD
jgi:hypothetical protein